MNKFFSLLRNNLATCWMLVFVVCFYSLLFFSNRETKQEGAAVEAKKTERITSEEFKKKEEVFRKTIQSRPRLMTVVSLAFLLVVFLGILVNIYLVARKTQGAPFFAGGIPQAAVPWGVKEIFQVFVFLFFVEAVVLFIEMSIGSFLDLKRIGKDFFIMLNSLLRDIGVAVFVVVLVAKRFKQPISEIGLTAKNFFKNIVTGFVGYLAIIPALLVLLFVLAAIARFFSYEPPPQPVVEMYLKESTEPYLVFFTFFVAIVGPAIEEIFFRGFTYKALRTRFGIKSAMLGSALIFAALHMNFIAFVPILFLGLFLAYLYEKTGSLVPSMTVHMLHNFIMVALTLGFKSLSAG